MRQKTKALSFNFLFDSCNSKSQHCHLENSLLTKKSLASSYMQEKSILFAHLHVHCSVQESNNCFTLLHFEATMCKCASSHPAHIHTFTIYSSFAQLLTFTNADISSCTSNHQPTCSQNFGKFSTLRIQNDGCSLPFLACLLPCCLLWQDPSCLLDCCNTSISCTQGPCGCSCARQGQGERGGIAVMHQPCYALGLLSTRAAQPQHQTCFSPELLSTNLSLHQTSAAPGFPAPEMPQQIFAPIILCPQLQIFSFYSFKYCPTVVANIIYFDIFDIFLLQLHVNQVDCLDAHIAGKRMDCVACGVNFNIIIITVLNVKIANFDFDGLRHPPFYNSSCWWRS